MKVFKAAISTYRSNFLDFDEYWLPLRQYLILLVKFNEWIFNVAPSAYALSKHAFCLTRWEEYLREFAQSFAMKGERVCPPLLQYTAGVLQ